LRGTSIAQSLLEAGAALADVALICRFAVKPVVNLERLEPVFAG
jgi:hypothetical protein